MASNSLGLGRGLDALIRETGVGKNDPAAHTLLLADIEPNPNQPRRQFDQKALEELSASIKSQGILQPILVRPFGENRPGKYSIVAGERRWRAAHLAGLVEVPVVIRTFTAQETLMAALIENLQREDLNPVEEALGIQTLKEEFGLSQEALAQQLGKSRSAVANALRLLSLSDVARENLSEGRLSAGHARALLSVTDDKAREYLRNLILEEHLSVREAEGLAAQWKESGSFHPESLSNAPADGVSTTATADSADGLSANPEGAAGRPSSTASSTRPKPQSARLLDLQTRLGESLNLDVKVTGKDSKGRISVNFNSREELDALLGRLGLASAGPALGGAERPALAGAGLAALEASEAPALGAAPERGALAASGRSALVGRTQSALNGSDHTALEPGAGVTLPAGEGAGE